MQIILGDGVKNERVLWNLMRESKVSQTQKVN